MKVEQGAVDTIATELNVTCRAGKNVKLIYVYITTATRSVYYIFILLCEFNP